MLVVVSLVLVTLALVYVSWKNMKLYEQIADYRHSEEMGKNLLNEVEWVLEDPDAYQDLTVLKSYAKLYHNSLQIIEDERKEKTQYFRGC